jgi:outer membrane receptor protein involved in Fe transport
MKRESKFHWKLIPVVAGLANTTVMAAESRIIEEVIVTAQRTEEPASKVPIAMSAFSDTDIKDRQIVGLSELHVSAPNVALLPRQGSTASNLHVRGLGWQAVGEEVLGAIHINEIPFPLLRAQTDLYDMERVEILRGPQGTLYGRNATAGAVNMITRRPSFEGFDGYLELELGDYEHRRIEGAVNLPVSDRLALRIAGSGLQRDGYIENTAGGQIPGVKKDVDGRDQYQLRLTGVWQISETTEAWIMYDRFDEDSSRAWDAPAVCKQSALPVNVGCEPNQFGRDLPHPGWSFLGVLMGLEDNLVPLGARDAATGLNYEFPRPALGAREVHWDGNSDFRLKEEIWNFGFERHEDRWSWDVVAGYQQSTVRTEQPNTSRGYPVGFTLGPTDGNPSGFWPTSAFAESYDQLRTTEGCEWDAYRIGVLGGCIADAPQTRGVAYTALHTDTKYWFAETKLRADVNETLSFLIGANYSDLHNQFFIGCTSNMTDMLALESIGGLLPVYPLTACSDSDSTAENYAGFGELYWQLAPAVKLTLGFRYSHDEKRSSSASTFFQSFDVNGTGFLGADPIWIRGTLLSYLGPEGPSEAADALADYYGATDALAAAGNFGELIAALQLVPPVEAPGELRALSGLPGKLIFKEWGGRAAVDWVINPDAMVYAKYDRGFLPGSAGFAARQPDMDSEVVDSFEFGAKFRLLNDTLRLDFAAFLYRYHDMRVGPGTGLQFGAANVDVHGHGAELDIAWRPARLPNLAVNLAYGWVDVELAEEYAEVDGLNPTQGDPAYVALNSFGSHYVAPVADVLPLVDQAIADGAAIGEAGAPGTIYPNGIPAYFNRGYLEANGVATLDGILAQMKGNQPRHAPEHNVNLGVAYSWFLAPGTLTARWDYYWQDVSYGAVFNSPYDRIDSWGQHNASLIFESADGHWDARLWGRNLGDEDNVYGRGNRQQIVYGEPRIYGVSLRYNWGG